MITLILAASPWTTAEAIAPAALTPRGGQIVLETVVQSVLDCSDDRVVLVSPEQAATTWHLDHTLARIDSRCSLLTVQSPTLGAACSALLAVDLMRNAEELLILAGDEYLRCDYRALLNCLRTTQADAGTIVFESRNPRYSFVQVDSSGDVQRCAEKDPISSLATAGFYWFRHSSLFVQAAFDMIRKRDFVNGALYVCPSFNQLILAGHRISTIKIDSSDYIPLKNQVDVLASAIESNQE